MKQRRFLLSILMLMLCMVYAVAEPVTKDQALQKAKTFLAKKGLAAKTSLNLAYQGRQRGQQKGAPVKNPSYYVFNNGHEGGFVIIAGDDCAEDVLGYADNGSFDAENIPSNMQAFLEGYAEEIAAARARGAKAADDNATVEKAHKVVAPLIETHWGQNDPYNQLCKNPNGDKCVTGCVATAFAQVMYYYKWPQEATTTIPNTFGSSYPDLPSTTFKWDKMKLAYINTGEDDVEAEQAVAELMWYCGHAVKMSYGTGSSGAYEGYITSALKNYFGYPGNPALVQRSDYTTEEWDELIYKELKYGRPVLYGADTSGNSGHEFICDGYDGHGLYHINWGWGGLADGYFRLQALRPSSQGTGGSGDFGGYSLGQDAIIGVCNTEINNNNEESASPSSALLTRDLRVTSDNTTMEYNSSNGFANVLVYYEYSLSGTQDGIDLGLGLYQDGELLQKVVAVNNKTLGAGYYYYYYDFDLYGLGTNLADGNYQIMGINRVHGTEEWYPNVGDDIIDVVISNGIVTFTNVENTPNLSIVVTRVEDRFDLLEEVTQVRAYVRNTGNAEYSGSLVLYVDGYWKAKEGVYLPIDGEDYVDFFFDYTTGSVNLKITDASGNVLYTKNGFNLREWSSQESPFTADVKLKNISDDGKMYGSVLDGTITLRNCSTDLEGYLDLELNVYQKTEGGYTYSSPKTQLIPFSIKAGEEKTIPVSFSALAVGDKFRYTLLDPFGNYLAGRWGFVEVVPGVVYWKRDGSRYAVAAPESEISFGNDVAAFSLEDFGDSFNFDVECSNPNAICYVTANCEASFETKITNMVRGGNASSITLDGNNDFFVPKRFFASEISYSREMTLGADGRKGWQTITLPFAVEKVYSEKIDDNVDWYHGNDTEEKDFWVREFKQVKGNTVQFANAEEWVPNVPYIIAVPGNKWGDKYDMRGKVDFGADDVWVEKSTVSAVVSDSYEFVGLTGGFSTPSSPDEIDKFSEFTGEIYVLNEEGSAFVHGSADLIEMRNLCYFTINDRTITPPAQLNIGTFDETDGICMPQVTVTDGQQVDVFTIDGVKVANVNVIGGKADLNQLPKGIYVVGGKKIVR